MKAHQPELCAVLNGLLVRMLNDFSAVLPMRSQDLQRDIRYVEESSRKYGIEFFTKTLPIYGKALDYMLSHDSPARLCVDSNIPSKTYGITRIPAFMSGYWKYILSPQGSIRWNTETPLASEMKRVPAQGRREHSKLPVREAIQTAVCAVRQVSYLAYKLELSYPPDLEQAFLDNFAQVDTDLGSLREDDLSYETICALDSAKIVLWGVLKDFDPWDIVPRHGPGALATGEKPWEKFNFAHYFKQLDTMYPYSDYMYYNYSHLITRLWSLEELEDCGAPCARVTLVPKDARGPRIISMEPLELQWIQQGLARALMKTIESSPVSSGYVNFTDQEVNRELALRASCGDLFYEDNRYILKPSKTVTLDMKEASDRVSVWLVRRLFGWNQNLVDCLLACRSQKTELPDKRVIDLNKFAPMGSAVCFPIEALCFWSLCVGMSENPLCMRHLRRPHRTWVFGDDIITNIDDYDKFRRVFGELRLMFNEDKCCRGGFFRESCGMDAYLGINVTPLKLRNADVTLQSPTARASWISYANALENYWNERGFDVGVSGLHTSAEYLRNHITHLIGPIPLRNKADGYPLSFYSPEYNREQIEKSLNRFRRRFNKSLHLKQWRLPILVPVRHRSNRADGWLDLMEYKPKGSNPLGAVERIQPGVYALPHAMKLGWAWLDLVSLIK